jgi:hypothetical protein
MDRTSLATTLNPGVEAQPQPKKPTSVRRRRPRRARASAVSNRAAFRGERVLGRSRRVPL